MLRHTVRLGRIVVGVMLMALGVILALPLVPGPGLLLVAIGLGLLSQEFAWARKLRSWAYANFDRLAGRRNVG